VITTLVEAGEIHPASLVTVKVNVPAESPVSVVLVPEPVVLKLSGLLIMVHGPVDGKPFNTTLPPPPVQLTPVTVPGTGAAGTLFTVRAIDATAAWQGEPRGLLVVAVMVTILPLSPVDGVYVNENGEVVKVVALKDPDPLLLTVTLVALPPKVFPESVNGVVPHVLSLAMVSESFGAFTQPQLTANIPERVVQTCAFLTAR
jgi:hypothetical protein